MRPESADGAGEIQKSTQARASAIPRWTDQDHRTIHRFFLQTLRRLQNEYGRLKMPRIQTVDELRDLLLGSTGLPILNDVNNEGQAQASGYSR